jgi:hypothetical protein
MRLKVRSMVGLIPLFAVWTFDLNPLRRPDEFGAASIGLSISGSELAETLRRLRERTASGGMMLPLPV